MKKEEMIEIILSDEWIEYRDGRFGFYGVDWKVSKDILIKLLGLKSNDEN